MFTKPLSPGTFTAFPQEFYQKRFACASLKIAYEKKQKMLKKKQEM